VCGTAANGDSYNLIAALASCKDVLKNERHQSQTCIRTDFIPSLKHQPK
jgi:hypothetical protein